MTTTHTAPPDGWQDSDRVRPRVADDVAFVTSPDPIIVKHTRLDGRSYTYRLTRIRITADGYMVVGGVKIGRAGRVIGNGGVSYITDSYAMSRGDSRIEVL